MGVNWVLMLPTAYAEHTGLQLSVLMKNTNPTPLSMVPIPRALLAWMEATRALVLGCHSKLPKLSSQGQFWQNLYSRCASSWRAPQKLSRSHCYLCKHKSGLGDSFFYEMWWWLKSWARIGRSVIGTPSICCLWEGFSTASHQARARGMKWNNRFAARKEHSRWHAVRLWDSLPQATLDAKS